MLIRFWFGAIHIGRPSRIGTEGDYDASISFGWGRHRFEMCPGELAWRRVWRFAWNWFPDVIYQVEQCALTARETAINRMVASISGRKVERYGTENGAEASAPSSPDEKLASEKEIRDHNRRKRKDAAGTEFSLCGLRLSRSWLPEGMARRSQPSNWEGSWNSLPSMQCGSWERQGEQGQVAASGRLPGSLQIEKQEIRVIGFGDWRYSFDVYRSTRRSKVYVYLTGAKERGNPNHVLRVCPGALVPKNEVPEEWMDNGEFKKYELVFVHGRCSVDEQLGKLLVEKGIAQKTNLIRRTGSTLGSLAATIRGA